MSIQKSRVFTILLAVMLSVVPMLTGCDRGGGYTDYGQGVADTTDLTPIEKIAADPASFAGQQVTIQGIVASVCPTSGCFLNVGAGAASLRVDLAPNDFTIPPGRNAGHKVFVHGEVRVQGDQAEIVADGLRIMDG
jgi:hypothetical protein